MTTITYKRSKLPSGRGRPIQFSTDPVTHARLVWASRCITRVLGMRSSLGTVYRLGAMLALEHLERVAQRLADESVDADKRATLLMQERARVRSASAGGSLPWATFPMEDLEADPMPALGELIRAHYAKGLQIGDCQ